MSNRTTHSYRTTFSGSVGAGMGSLFNPNGRKYYILEHKVSSKYHKAGESQEIIVDNIELGRDSHCQVRFDDSFKTVSRHHAGIVREGDGWKLVQISQTNSTFLNGRPVTTEWYLQNGDEIQLSVNGPKLGFILPAGKKSTVGSIGLTRRLSLFRQQALRPYKTALTALSCVLALVVVAVTYSIIKQDGFIKELKIIAERQDTINDSMANQISNYQKSHKAEVKKYMDSIAKDIKKHVRPNPGPIDPVPPSPKPGPNGLVDFCNPYTYAIYQIRQVCTDPDGEVFLDDKNVRCIGTGFMLSDGRFVTARHVVESYYFPYFINDEKDPVTKILNVIVCNGGDITTDFVAVSSSGDKLAFTNKQCRINRKQDQNNVFINDDMAYTMKTSVDDTKDWAYVKTGRKGMAFDADYSVSLPATTNLNIVGFPYALGAQDPSAINPIYSNAMVACEGLSGDGTIMTSNTDILPGNSGGPVIAFKKDNNSNKGSYFVVGIVSGKTAGKGCIVPINCVK